MKSTTYLFIFFIIFSLTHCKKPSDDLLLPIAKTGTYYDLEQETIIGEIKNLSSEIDMIGHVWDTFPSPSLGSYAGISHFFNYNEMTVNSHMHPVVPDRLYYVVIYWKDVHGNIGYGDEIIVHTCL